MWMEDWLDWALCLLAAFRDGAVGFLAVVVAVKLLGA